MFGLLELRIGCPETFEGCGGRRRRASTVGLDGYRSDRSSGYRLNGRSRLLYRSGPDGGLLRSGGRSVDIGSGRSGSSDLELT